MKTMYINLCPGAVGIRNRSFDELIRLAVENGFGGVDLPAEAVGSRETALEAARKVSDANLEWGLFGLPCDFSNADDGSYRNAMRSLHRILPTIALAGCRRCYNHIWPGSNLRSYMSNFRWHVSRFRPLVELLGEYGITLGLEFIGPKTLRDEFRYPFASTLDEAVELGDAISPVTGLVIDFFHLYASGGTVEDLKKTVPVDRITNIHANDAVKNRERTAQMDMEREMPLAAGVVDSAGIVGWLNDLGYTGPIIAEPFYPNVGRFGSMPASEVAREVGECMRSLLSCGDPEDKV